MSKFDMNNCEEQEMKNIRPILRKWFDRLFNKNEMEKKLKINRYTLKDNIIRDIRTIFETKMKKERKTSIMAE